MHHPIYLFRHGETVWNAEKRAQGRLDSPLTDAGRAQARPMGAPLSSLLRGVAGYSTMLKVVSTEHVALSPPPTSGLLRDPPRS